MIAITNTVVGSLVLTVVAFGSLTPVCAQGAGHASGYVAVQTEPNTGVVTTTASDGARPLPDSGTADADALRQQLETVRGEEEALRKKEQSLRDSVAERTRQQEMLVSQQIETSKRLQAGEVELNAIDQRLAELKVKADAQRAYVHTQQRKLMKLLAILQRMGRDPPPVLITRRDDALKMVRSALLLSASFPQLRDQANELAKRLADFDRVLADTKIEQERQKAALAKDLEQSRLLEQQLADNKKAIEAEVAQFAPLREAFSKVGKRQADLTGLLNMVVAATGNPEGQLPLRSTLGKDDQVLEEPPVQFADASGATGSDAANDALVEAQRQALLDKLARNRPTRAFESLKHKLPLPIAGRRLLGFGQMTKNGIKLKGEAYATRSKALVIAPCDGAVLFAGEFKSYGQVLIIDAGNGYHILLAGLSQVDVTMGQFVLAQQPVGRMGTKRAGGGDGTKEAPPLFYVEFRHKEQPINPAPWWSAELEKVQG